jgi:hypothetical protein
VTEPVLFRQGDDFLVAAVEGDHFQSLDQVEAAAQALERLGLVRREPADGGERWVVVRGITASQLAAVLTADHKQREAGS